MKKEIVTYKGVPIRLSADFSKETLQARRDWQEVLEVIKSKDLQSTLFYPAKLSCTIEGQIKCLSDKVKLEEIIITKQLLYEMLRDFFKKKKMIKTMSIKMAINSQLSTIESKN